MVPGVDITMTSVVQNTQNVLAQYCANRKVRLDIEPGQEMRGPTGPMLFIRHVLRQLVEQY